MSYDKWKETKLSEVIDLFNGKERPDDLGKIPVYGGNGIMSYTKTFNYNDENVIIGRVGAYCGNVNYHIGNIWVSDNAINIKPKRNVSYGKFIYYLLIYQDLHSKRIGSSQPLITQRIIKDLEVKIPVLVEQKVIANILSSLDDKIELNNRINKNLEETAQTLYKQWFVDFEFPNEFGEPYKSSGGEMVESELGLIPKGWNLNSLLAIADYMNGVAVKKYVANENEESLPVLKIKELGQGDCTINSDRCNLSVPEKYVIRKGDLIFSWSGSLLVDFWTGTKSILNQHLFKVSSKKYPRWFYYFWTTYHLKKFQNIAKSMATTMGHIKRNELEKSLVVIPDSNSILEGTIILEPMIDEILKLRIQNNKLKKLRDELLPKLMSGEIEVPIKE